MYAPPKVEYVSGNQECSLLQKKLLEGYKAMIQEGLALVKDKLHMWAEFHDGPSMGVSSYWYGEGFKLWLEFTKGNDEPWCEHMAHVTHHMLLTSCNAAFAAWKQATRQRQTNQQIYDMLLPILLSTLKSFLFPDFSPNHFESFVEVNHDTE